MITSGRRSRWPLLAIAGTLIASGCGDDVSSSSNSDELARSEVNASASEAPLRSDLDDPAHRMKLRDVALRASSGTGVPHPTRLQAVAVSDCRTAHALLGGETTDNSPAYVIKITGGRFTAMHHPAGAPAPQGSVLTLIVDAATLGVMDLGITDVEPDLGKLGPIVELGP